MHAAVSLLGWILPDTGTAATATSRTDEDIPFELPDELQDPLAVLDGDREKVTQTDRQVAATDT